MKSFSRTVKGELDRLRTGVVRLLAAALSVHCLQAHADAPTLQPIGGIWPAGPGFVFPKKSDKTRQSVSGIACALNHDQARVCLYVFDEGTEARFAQVDAGKVVPLSEAVAFDIPAKELDAEGAATDGNFFYVTGSHAVKRGDCKANPGSRYVLRFRRDARTGLALRAPPGGTALAGYQQSNRLLSILSADGRFKGLVEQGRCLGEGGFDIEGLAVRQGRLHFGLRGPTEDRHAFIVSVDAEALFGNTDPQLALTRVEVGQGRGIRDMVAIDGGILLLAGPDDRKEHADAGWTVSLWNDQFQGGAPAEPKRLATLDLRKVKAGRCDAPQTKPEAITVLEASAQRLRVLVLSDGLCDGGALLFEIPR